MKTKTKTFHCRYCDTIETWPEKEYNMPIVRLYCPRCSARGKRRMMKEIIC